jgi:hypothetical protein
MTWAFFSPRPTPLSTLLYARFYAPLSGPRCALLASVALLLLLPVAGCGTPGPSTPLPTVHATTPSERLPIDGLWKTAGEPPAFVQIERGRLYLQAGFGAVGQHGTLLYADIHQRAAQVYRCRQPVGRQEGIDWRPCTLRLDPDGWLRASTPSGADGEEGYEQRFEPVALADETWFSVQADAWHIVSVPEAYEPPPEVPRAEDFAVVPALPPSAAPREVAVPLQSDATRFGRYVALVIGTADYTYLPAVETADGDAAAVSNLLSDGYGFEVTHLRNPSLGDLTAALARYERELGPNDNLLVYFAGHGIVSSELGRCYWFPIEAMGDDTTQGLGSDEVAAALGRMKAKHVMIVADSCFTASQRRDAGLQDESNDAQEKLSKLRTRVVLSSGGIEPIQDGKGSHSVFTGAFLAALDANREVLDGTALFEQIQQRTTGASQAPEYANVRDAERGGGDFLFVPVR